MYNDDMNTTQNELVCGRNAVTELIKTAPSIDTLYVCGDSDDKAIRYIISLAKDKGAVIKEVPPAKMNKLCRGERHQGVAVYCSICEYAEVEDMFALAAERGEPPFLVLCDGIEDPHNMGAIIRTAECAGAHGVIIPRRRGCGITAAVHRASAGALSHMLIARENNLANVIRSLKERGVFCYCADMDGESAFDADLSGAAALIVGSEGFGVSHLVKELCDKVVSLPMRGSINSLNASVAAGILLYEIRRDRDKR